MILHFWANFLEQELGLKKYPKFSIQIEEIQVFTIQIFLMKILQHMDQRWELSINSIVT
jgi:hypothetical protein